MLAKPILLAKPVEGRSPVSLSVTEVRAIVLRSQRLAEDVLPFGLGKTAVLVSAQVEPLTFSDKESIYQLIEDYSHE